MATVENEKKIRTAERSSFTRLATKLKKIISEGGSCTEINGLMQYINESYRSLRNSDQKIRELLIETAGSDGDLDNENISCEKYGEEYYMLKATVDVYGKQESQNLSQIYQGDTVTARKIKLPMLEIKKFDGQVKNWFHFWNSFKKIHDDSTIVTSDKFQYLLQAMEKGSRARTIVESFPPTEENYQVALNSLKSRFGREDLQIEVFIRELLSMILNNIKENSLPLSTLYDRLDSYIRALESLGVTTEKCACMLFPLVESALPIDLLRVWQRKQRDTEVYEPQSNSENSAEIRLKKLMKFLGGEVEDEERATLAISGFGLLDNSGYENPTASELLTSERKTTGISKKINERNYRNNEKLSCIFCEKTHSSETCTTAKDLSYEERRNIANIKKVCFICLKSNHFAKKCGSIVKCLLCAKRHVSVMCHNLSCVGSKTKTSDTENNLCSTSVDKIISQTLVVKLKGPKRDICVRAIIDSGSQRSYVTKNIALELGCKPSGEIQLTHLLFGGKSEVRNHYTYQINVSKKDNDSPIFTFNVLDQPIICKYIGAINKGPWLEELSNKGIFLSDLVDGPIDLLLGCDSFGKLLTGNRVELKCGLVAIETKLGWTMIGKIPFSEIGFRPKTSSVLSMLIEDLDLSQLWSLDTIGIRDPTESMSKTEIYKAVKEHFLETVHILPDGRYEVSLPWKVGHPPLQTNYDKAKKVLISIGEKLKNENLTTDYREVLDDWLGQGIVELVPNNESGNGKHYLPHWPIIKESSTTTKIRPVFNASAKSKEGVSLNSCLENGENLLVEIPDIIIRFRLRKIGVVADIKQAFLQISVTENDRDYLRFLWLDHDGKILEFRHCRVVFGVINSPYMLSVVIQHLLDREDIRTKYSPTFLEALKNNMYVDNCIVSLSTELELIQFINEATAVLNEGKFLLRGWEYSNQDGKTKVLGLDWNKKNDSFSVSRDIGIPMNTIITRRIVLSVVNKIFDPIGFTCPVTIWPKLLLQKTWKQKTGWDKELDIDTRESFLKWFADMYILKNIEVPRCIIRKNNPKISLHVFCDASKGAYASVIYLRVESEEDVNIEIVRACNRVSPLKVVSIPRLELLAALIGARLYNSIIKAMCWSVSIDSYFWSDSTTTLAWLTRQEHWSIFVWNRVLEIRELTNVNQWRYVPGDLNPADLPSRGCNAKQLKESRWWEGPDWLKGDYSTWPDMKLDYNESEINSEHRKTSTTILHNHVVKSNWYYRYFSNYNKLVRMIAWVLRFINNCKLESTIKSDLLVDEISKAETTLIKLVQPDTWTVNDKDISSLNPFFDNYGVLRVRTKISQGTDSLDFRFPALLPNKHPVTKLIIKDAHEKNHHIGIQGLVSLIRERFWVLRTRQTVRSVISHCVICRRHRVKKIITPVPGPLPLDRVRDAAVFEVTGVDFVGPLHLRQNEKAWICVFTCAVIRAVHFELVSSLSTESFIQALRRFVSRRGRPNTIYSDNGTNFVGTNNAFAKLNWTKIEEYSTVQRIKWKFNPVTACWWGGWWERIVRMLKDLLRRTLGRSQLTYEELTTVLCECERIVNARPLTYLSEDPSDLTPLTPGFFLQGIREVGLPDCDFLEETSLGRRAAYRQSLQNQLRQRFRSEYLGQLAQRRPRNQHQKEIKEGDIVIVGNDQTKSLEWPLARIIETIPGKDGVVRLVRLQTMKGVCIRPIQRIYVLESQQ